MNKSNEKKVKLDFFRLTGIAPIYKTNKLSDNCVSKNVIFQNLAEKVFDAPKLLKLLEVKIKQWLSWVESDFTYALAGYIYYYKEDFKTATKYFIKAINVNPENLDIWFCLSFSLYRQERDEQELAKKILFGFDYCIKKFKSKTVSIKALESAFLINQKKV